MEPLDNRTTLDPEIPILILQRGLQTLKVTYWKDHRRRVFSIRQPDTLALITYGSLNPDLVDVYYSVKKWVCYDQTVVLLDAEKWPIFRPTMDTLLLLDNLRRMEVFRQAESLVNIGTGCGLDFKFCLQTMPRLRHALGTEINPLAVQATLFNLEGLTPRSRYLSDTNSLTVSPEADARRLCTSADLIISNPAYLPSPGGEYYPPDSFEAGFTGTGMLEYVLEYASEVLRPHGQLVMVFSDLAMREYERQRDASGLIEVSRFSRELSFKIDLVVNNQDWVDYLVRERGLKVYSARPGTNYRHTIHVVALVRSDAFHSIKR